MSEQELRQTLKELRRELAEVGDVGGELEEMLAEIRSDIEAVMERSAPHSFRERLSEAAQRFEASHPSLASAMAAVIDQLASIGV
jgi:hypothetical protein